MRRQFSNSWTISTGNPARTKIHFTACSLLGPMRTLTRLAFRLTKRGSGRPVVCWASAGGAAGGIATSTAAASPTAPHLSPATILESTFIPKTLFAGRPSRPPPARCVSASL